MKLEQFAFFLFDLTTIWCNLNYGNFLFFLGTLFLWVTDASGVNTVGLKPLDHVRRLPKIFFDLVVNNPAVFDAAVESKKLRADYSGSPVD